MDTMDTESGMSQNSIFTSVETDIKFVQILIEHNYRYIFRIGSYERYLKKRGSTPISISYSLINLHLIKRLEIVEKWSDMSIGF